MRVLHVITTMDLGGAEKHVSMLAAAQVEAGHDVRIIYLSGNGLAVPRGVPSRRVSLSQLRQIHKVRVWLRQSGVVHAHLPRAEIVGVLLSSGVAPLVISRHNTEPFYGGTASGSSRRISRLLMSRAASMIAITHSVKNYHISTGHVPPQMRIDVIGYGYRPPDLTSQNFYDWGDRQVGVLRIACVARLTPQKDLPTLMNGVVRLRELGLSVDLRIAGAGPDLDELVALRDRLGLTQCVTFLGKIPNPESFTAGADLFALTSRYEGLGLVLLEAMAVGTPILASRNTAISEVIVDDSTGLLFETGNPDDFANAALRLLKTPDLAATMVSAASKRLQDQFSIDGMVAKTDEVYRAALERFH